MSGAAAVLPGKAPPAANSSSEGDYNDGSDNSSRSAAVGFVAGINRGCVGGGGCTVVACPGAVGFAAGVTVEASCGVVLLVVGVVVVELTPVVAVG